MYLASKTNNIRKVITKCILCLMLMIMILEQLGSISNAISFSDVSNTSWYYKDLVLLTNKNIISGYTDGTFKPSTHVTREQFIKMVISTLSILPFEKNSSSWSMPYLERASEYGIIPYQIDDTVLLKAPITREEVAYIICKSLDEGFGEYENLKDSISDYDVIGEAFNTSVLKIYSKGILAGYKDGSFKPNNYITRAEAVAVISRMIDASKRVSPDPDVLTYQLTAEDRNRLNMCSKNQLVDDEEEELPYKTIKELEAAYNINFQEMARKYVEDFLFEFDYRAIDENKPLLKKFADEILLYGYEKRYDENVSAILMKDDYIEKVFDRITSEEAIADALFFPTETYIATDNKVRVRGIIVQKYKQTNNIKYNVGSIRKKDVEIEIVCREGGEPGVSRFYDLTIDEKISGREYTEGGDLILTLDEINQKYNCDLAKMSTDYIENLEFKINYENVEYEELLKEYEKYYISNTIIPLEKSVICINGELEHTYKYARMKVDSANAYKMILTSKFDIDYDNVSNEENSTIRIPGKVTSTYESYDLDGTDSSGIYTEDITLIYKYTLVKNMFYLYGFDNN